MRSEICLGVADGINMGQLKKKGALVVEHLVDQESFFRIILDQKNYLGWSFFHSIAPSAPANPALRYSETVNALSYCPSKRRACKLSPKSDRAFCTLLITFAGTRKRQLSIDFIRGALDLPYCWLLQGNDRRPF